MFACCIVVAFIHLYEWPLATLLSVASCCFLLRSLWSWRCLLPLSVNIVELANELVVARHTNALARGRRVDLHRRRCFGAVCRRCVLGVGGRDCLLDGKVDRATEEQRRLSDSLGAMDCSLVVVVENNERVSA